MAIQCLQNFWLLPLEVQTKALRGNQIYEYITLVLAFLPVLCSLNLKGLSFCHRNLEEHLSIETLFKVLNAFHYAERGF